MKWLLLCFYKLFFVFIAIPLFFDLGSMSWVAVDVESYGMLDSRPVIPVPIGAFALFLAIVLGYILSILSPDRMQSNMPPRRLVVFYVVAVIPVFIYIRFVADLSGARIAQVMLPMLFISMLSFPRRPDDRLDVFKYLMIGASVFFWLHLGSIFESSERITRADYLDDFSFFYGYLIYQSLVSYPGVLSLYLILTFATIYSVKLGGISLSPVAKLSMWGLPFVLLYLLAVSGRRAFLVEFFSAALVIICSALMYVLINGKLRKRAAFNVLMFSGVVIAFFFFYIISPLSERVLQSVASNTFDSGRLGILALAYDYFINNPMILVFGGGPLDTPGFHNYILDQIYRIGLFGFFIIYGINGYLVLRFLRVIDFGTEVRFARSVFMLVLLSCLFWQSMINASISQPYYFINFLMVALVCYFVLLGRRPVMQF